MAALNDLLDFQTQNTRQLLDLLQAEQKAIAERNSASIATLAKNKFDLVAQIQATDQRIGDHPQLDELSSNQNYIEQVADIRRVLEECQTLNSVNGESLQRAHLSFNKLNNLLQQSHGKVGMTYNAGGQTHTASTLGTNLKA